MSLTIKLLIALIAYIMTHSNKYAAIIDDDGLNAVTPSIAIMPHRLASISDVSDDIVM